MAGVREWSLSVNISCSREQSHYFSMCYVRLLDSENSPFLQQLLEWGEGEDIIDKESCTVCYFERVMRLFEQESAPQYIIKAANSATLLLSPGNPKSVSAL